MSRARLALRSSFEIAVDVVLVLALAGTAALFASCGGGDDEGAAGGGPAAPGTPTDPRWEGARRDTSGSTAGERRDATAPPVGNGERRDTAAGAPTRLDGGAGDAPPPAPPQLGGPCQDVQKATAPQGGNAPSVYGGAWTPAPTEGCTFVDGDGRTVTLTAIQHRMIYRVNEVRALQSAQDGRPRPELEADLCLQEFSQGYAESKPGGHSEMNLSWYKIPGGGQGTGGNFIGENYGAHGGYTKDPMSAVDRLVNGWWNSGGTDSGHRGNMLNPKWTKGGMGVVVSGSSALGIQTFSRKYANWQFGWAPCTRPPKVDDPMSTIPKPIER